MADLITEAVYGFIFMMPAFLANAVPVFIGGFGPIDRGMKFFDGRPLLGKNKTIGGLFSAIIAGGMVGIAIYFFFPKVMGDYPIWIGFLEGFGAMVGDSFGSFLKRRINLKPGGPFPPFDQIGFVLFAFLIVSPVTGLNWVWLGLVCGIALFIHLIANIFAYKMGWKDVWW